MTDLLVNIFSNKVKIEIIDILFFSPCSLSVLSKKIGYLSNSEVSRHLGSLMENFIVQKGLNRSKIYELTAFGRLIKEIINPVLFLTKDEHLSYFKDHSFMDLPTHLLRSLDYLESSEIITGTGNIMTEMSRIVQETKTDLWLMVNTSFPFSKDDLKIKKKFIISESMYNQVEVPTEVLSTSTSLEVGIIPSVPITLGIRDKDAEAMILFPKSQENNPDYSNGILVTDDNGIKYLQSIWFYYWDQSSKKTVK